jgi:hypothetical protein
MLDTVLSVLLIVAVGFLIYELRRFSVLHAKKYEVPTEKIWEKFVGIRPDDMTESNLTEKVQHLDSKMNDVNAQLDKQRKLTKKLIEELGK